MFLYACLGFTLLWSVYSWRRYHQNKKLLAEIFYKEILCQVKHARLENTNNQYLQLTGEFRSIPIKFVPVIDSLDMRSLPRLILRIYIGISSDFKCRILKVGAKDYLYPALGFEERQLILKVCDQYDFLLFTKEELLPRNLAITSEILSRLKNCEEIVIDKNMMRVSIPVQTAQKGSYMISRVAEFSKVSLRHEFVDMVLTTVVSLRDSLREGVTLC